MKTRNEVLGKALPIDPEDVIVSTVKSNNSCILTWSKVLRMKVTGYLHLS